MARNQLLLVNIATEFNEFKVVLFNKKLLDTK